MGWNQAADQILCETDYTKFWEGIDKVPIYDVGHTLRRREIAKNIPSKSKKILSVGSGYGEELLAFKESNPYATIFCIDLNPKALSRCRELLDAKTILTDATHLPFKRNYFDVILVLEVLEHIPDDTKVIEEVHRVLKEGGIVISSVPSGPLTEKWIKHGHLRHYSREEFLNLFESNGFKYVKHINYYGRVRMLYDPIKKILKSTNYLLNKLAHQDLEYVDRALYKLIVPFFLFLTRFESKMEPLKRKEIALFTKR